LFEKKVSIAAYSSFMKEFKIFPQSQALADLPLSI